MDTTMSIPTACTNLANAARIILELSTAPVTPDEAIDTACDHARITAHNARTRHGIWARETTTRQIEDTLFQGSVAADILDGKVERPSTGNVRAYTLNLIEEMTR